METQRRRCRWVDLNAPAYVAYHDQEWGVPVHEDGRLFEMLLLECFQAGLSWLTILRKREAFRRAFDGFDPVRIAAYDEEKLTELLADPGIIRNRAKIRAAVQNARVFLEIQRERGSFDAYLWSFTKGKSIRNREDRLPVKTELSDAVSKDLKRRGMAFVGSVTIYAYLQAVGVVNDHETACFRYEAEPAWGTPRPGSETKDK